MKPTELTLQQADLLIAHYQILLEGWELHSQYQLPDNHPIDELYDNPNSVRFLRCTKGETNLSIEEICLKFNLPQPSKILQQLR